VADAQTESCTLADGLSRKERIKNSVEHFVRNATASVYDRQMQTLAVRGCVDSYRSAGVRRIQTVLEQIDQKLLHLGRAYGSRRQVVFDATINLDTFFVRAEDTSSATSAIT
jgi:hypothetical protein